MMDSRVVVGYKLQQYIEPSVVRHLARTMLLYRDQQNFHSELSKKKATTRFEDSSTTRTRNMIALLKADHNTSMMDIPADDHDDGLFSPDDIDVNKTQEMMVTGSSRDPILDFVILSEFIEEIRCVYTDKLDTMSKDDLVEEALSEALHQRLKFQMLTPQFILCVQRKIKYHLKINLLKLNLSLAQAQLNHHIGPNLTSFFPMLKELLLTDKG